MNKLTIASILLSTIFSIGASIGFQKLNQEDIVTFDIKGTTAEFLKQSMSLKLDERGNKLLADKFSSSLQQSLVEYQKDHNVIILVSPAVISGANDVTQDIRLMISEKMKK